MSEKFTKNKNAILFNHIFFINNLYCFDIYIFCNNWMKVEKANNPMLHH